MQMVGSCTYPSTWPFRKRPARRPHVPGRVLVGHVCGSDETQEARGTTSTVCPPLLC